MRRHVAYLTCLALYFNICYSQINPPTPPVNTNQEKYMSFERSNSKSIIHEPVEPSKEIIMGFKLKSSGCQYTSNSELSALSAEDLITYLKSTEDYECHGRILFNYEEAYSPIIFENTKIQAVANEINNIESAYDGTHSTGLYGLLLYLHVASYFDFYYNETIQINTTSKNAIITATDSLCSNDHMFDLNADAAEILREFIILLDMDDIRSRPATIDFVKNVMINMLIEDTWKTSDDIKWVTGYWHIFYLMFRGIQDSSYVNAIANDTNFISLLGGIAIDSEIRANDQLNYLWQDNAVGELARMATNSTLVDLACPHLASVADTFPRLHSNWLKSVIAINNAGKCDEYNLCENGEDLRDEVEEMLFPNTYNYDDGNLVFRVKFSRETADNLYYATKQTSAQFFRLAQTDQPVEGDTNEKLTAIVFESKDAYDDYAGFLYGISTNNGGMYLEQRAEFYTWDRPATYSISLEELFRHEYIHYLQGRYLIPGNWGSVPIYDNDRLTWYEEGHAEFLSASTDFEGVKLKASARNRLLSDYPNYPTLSEVLSSYYGVPGSIYYPYGCLLWYNWYINDYRKIKRFIDYTRNNDITAFDALVDSLKNSTGAENQWQDFISDVYTGDITAWQPSTNWINDTNLTVATLSDIQDEFIRITGISDITVTEEAQSIIRRFKISGSITEKDTLMESVNRAFVVNLALDSIMNLLRNDLFINNFDYIVGYATDIVHQDSLLLSNMCITGSLRDSSISDTPITDFTSDKKTILAGTEVQFTSLSKGYIKGYKWSFPGGHTSDSTSPNPVVNYNHEGIYNVSLTTLGKSLSDSSTKVLYDYIKVIAPSTNDYCTPSNEYDYAWISHVALNEIDNYSSGFPQDGYSDFSSDHVTELMMDSSYSVNIDLSYINSPFMVVSLWIDLNQNGLFSDEGEQLLFDTIPQLTQLSNAIITIPTSAVKGVTRMRVRSKYSASSDISPCENDSYMGETEDYTVYITEPPLPSAPYCMPNNGYDYSWISRVALNEIDNSSHGFPDNGYSNFSESHSTELEKNKEYPITVNLSYTNSPNTKVAVWVDLNQNNSFDDEGERLLFEYVPQLSQLSDVTITIPSDALTGITRMRVRSKYTGDSTISPCEHDYYMGEVEDYTVVIKEPEVPPLSYCIPSNGYDYAWISRVVLNEIDNSSEGFPANGYADYTLSDTTRLAKTVSYPMSVDLSYTNSPSMFISVWIDLNQNASFEDTGEKLFFDAIPQLTQLSNASIVIPSSALTGYTRMRVRSKYSSNFVMSPCGHDNYMGEVEDYTILIEEPGQINELEKINAISHKKQRVGDFNITPNPNNGKFTIQFENLYDTDIILSIYNSVGICIQTLTLHESKGKVTQELNIEDYSDGIYFIRLQFNEGQNVKTIRILKQE